MGDMNFNLKIHEWEWRDVEIQIENIYIRPKEVPLVRVWGKVQRLPLGKSHRRTQGSTCNHIKVKRANLSICFLISSATLYTISPILLHPSKTAFFYPHNKIRLMTDPMAVSMINPTIILMSDHNCDVSSYWFINHILSFQHQLLKNNSPIGRNKKKMMLIFAK